MALPFASFTLGFTTAFILRDQANLPNFMRIKLALLEYYMHTNQRGNIDVLDGLDPDLTKKLFILQRQKLE